MLRELFTGRQESAALSRLSEASAVPPDPGESFRPKRSALVVDDDPDIPPVVDLALAGGFFVAALAGLQTTTPTPSIPTRSSLKAFRDSGSMTFDLSPRQQS